MKFQVKALVAALALSAASVSAQAAVALASTGNSSLVLSVVDRASNISATFDLGYNYTSFSDLVAAASSGSFTWDLATGDYADAWSTFSSAANLGTAKWAIYAADGLGSGVGQRGTISTYVSGNKLTATQQLNTQIANFDNYLNAVNVLPGHIANENGAGTSTGGNSYVGGLAYGSAGMINGQGHVSTGNFGDTLTVVQQLSGASVGSPTSFATLGNAEGNYTFSINNSGVLSFNVPTATTPVPEADSYAMLLVGLGVVGLIARRRKA